MLSSCLLYFNVFLLLVDSSPQNTDTLLKDLNYSAAYYKNIGQKMVEKYEQGVIEMNKLIGKINEELASENKTIDEYVKCKIQELNAKNGLSTLPYLTTNEVEKWTNNIEDQKEKWIGFEDLNKKLVEGQKLLMNAHYHLLRSEAAIDVYREATATIKTRHR
ncbi:hypothetical protein EWB00_000323 [Schistosoma japonicum]|uniref:Uncharacterized protein n=1 Tax=Schistosoma japonicum TaxID=6182 RepID=A0A4Z2DXL4_SCHJA|nr:hypothetical protein EWB00_000323 [Schistosoma japonicum]